MFERYTEKARRVLFFARHEASHYGSQTIETEHLLLGLLREDGKVVHHLIPTLPSPDEIRAEIERHVTRGERISTSVEMPLSKECTTVLKIAAEEARRLGHPHVGTEHLVLGLLRVEKSLAATILLQNQATIEHVLTRLETISGPARVAPSSLESTLAAWHFATGATDAELALRNFLDGLRAGLKDPSRDFFSPGAQFIDACGKRWSGEENLHAKLGELFAPFAARSAKYLIEEITHPRDGLCLASLLWEDVPLAEKTPKGLCRMIVALGRGEGESTGWSIYCVQVTPVTRL